MCERALTLITRHEGYRKHAYRCPSGKLTIGYGYNLDAGMPEDEARYLAGFRIRKLQLSMSARWPWFAGLAPTRKIALLDMAYQMGIDGLAGFEKTISMIETGDFLGASIEMLDSKWARHDSPGRALEIAEMLRNG